MPSQEAGTPFPATVLVRRRARPGCEHRLQAWAEALCADAHAMPGHLVSESFRSPVESGGELLLGMTFASPRDLLRWTDSAERASRLSTVADLTEGVAHAVPVDMLTWTLQTSSSTPATPGPVPRWVSASIIWLAIYPSAMLIAVLVGTGARRLAHRAAHSCDDRPARPLQGVCRGASTATPAPALAATLGLSATVKHGQMRTPAHSSAASTRRPASFSAMDGFIRCAGRDALIA